MAYPGEWGGAPQGSGYMQPRYGQPQPNLQQQLQQQPAGGQNLAFANPQPNIPQGSGMSPLGGGMYGVNPQSAEQLFMQGMAPAQWQANRNAMQAGAAGGLSGGPLNQVVTDANAQFLASMDPTIAQMVLQSQLFNADAANQGTLQNQLLTSQSNMQGNQNTLAGLGSLFGGLGGVFGLPMV